MLKITNINDTWVSLKDKDDCTYILEPGEEAEVTIEENTGLFTEIVITKRNHEIGEKPSGILKWVVPSNVK